MKIAYFDCLSGASGNLILASLIDAGADVRVLQKELSRALGPLRLKTSRRRSGAVSGTRLEVWAPRQEPGERSALELLRLAQDSRWPAEARAKILKVYRLLARAEARVHGVPASRVHFHELGRLPSIAGVWGTALALRLLGVRRVRLSSLALGEGRLETAHGPLPVPAPATLEILKGLPLRAARAAGESVTPTGAALARVLAQGFGPPPKLRLGSVGYGVGASGLFTRVLIGEAR